MQVIPNIFTDVPGPHRPAQLFAHGEVSEKALILLHGRGGSAADIAHLSLELAPNTFTLIPEAVSNTWYPRRFLQPQEENQPHLDSALAIISSSCTYLESLGIHKDKTVIAGFSQGACLVAEYLKRYPGLYGGAVIMSGGFIGSDTEAAMMPTDTLLAGTPVYIGCDRNDDHIPVERAELTAAGLTQAGAKVQLELFSEYGHRPHRTALEFLKKLLQD